MLHIMQIIHEFSKTFDKSRFSISGHNYDSRHCNIMFPLLIYFNHKNQLHLQEKSVLPFTFFSNLNLPFKKVNQFVAKMVQKRSKLKLIEIMGNSEGINH